MRHRKDGSLVRGKMRFKPGNRLGIEVVRRFIEQQDIGLLEQQPAKSNAPPLAAGENRNRRVSGRAAKRIKCLFELALDLPCAEMIDPFLERRLAVEEGVDVRFGIPHGRADLFEFLEQFDGAADTFADDLHDGLGGVQLRLLGQIPERDPLLYSDFAEVVRVDSRDELQQRALPRAVEAEHADLCSVIEGEGNILEYLPVRLDHLADADHGKDDLVVSHER